MPGDDQIFVVAQIAFAVTAVWWVGGVGVWLAALGRGRVAQSEASLRFTLPGCRWAARVVAAAGLGVLSACTPDTTQAPTLVWIGDATTQPPDTASPPRTSVTTPPPTTPPPTTPPPTTGPPVTLPPTMIERTPVVSGGPHHNQHRVVPGDHLWGIAAAHLAAAGDSKPSNATIAAHWRRLVIDNAATLRSGDPDLIHPGEIIELPARESND